MGIRFQCPNCKVLRAASERLLGREIKCPECGELVQVPSREQIEEVKRAKAKAAQEEEAWQRTLRRRQARPTVEKPLTEKTQEQVDERLAAEERALAAASISFVRPKPPADRDMDMTPMVDVTFLLLIFFMITASFSVQKSIQRPAQKQDEASTYAVTPPEENPDNVTVQVDEFNAFNIITVNWDRVAGSKQDLIVALNDAHSGNASGTQPTKLIVQAHEDCIHASVIAALDAGREAQFESFEVNTVEQFD